MNITERKIIDFLRYRLAKETAESTGIPLNTTLQAVIDLHECGYLAVVFDEDSDKARLVPVTPNRMVS